MKKFAFLLGLLLACSGTADEGAEDTGRSGRGDDVSDPRGRTDAAVADTSTTDAGPADTGTSGTDTSIVDVALPDVAITDTRPIDTGRRDTTIGRECAQVTAQGDPLYAPIDIIWGIDTSGSMNEEIAIVEANLADFVTFIEDSGLDVRVVMVADDSVCVPSPLSGGGCPTADTDSDRYRHVRRTIGSSNAYEVLVDAYPDYSDFLRRDAIKHFVVVSDDESDEQPTWFRDQIRSAGINYFIFHAIVSLTGTAPPFGQGCTGPHGDAEAKGDKYMLLAEMTDGTANSICEPDWSNTFDGIATNVISGAVLPCSYGVPDVGQGREVVYDEVAVFLNTNRLTRHTDVNGCSDRPGWYFDNNDAPTEIHLCAGLCGAGFEDVEVNIEFGCVKG